MQNAPESPEAVAFALLTLIIEKEARMTSNRPESAHLLDLYVLCLAAVCGRRDVSNDLVH